MQFRENGVVSLHWVFFTVLKEYQYFLFPNYFTAFISLKDIKCSTTEHSYSGELAFILKSTWSA